MAYVPTAVPMIPSTSAVLLMTLMRGGAASDIGSGILQGRSGCGLGAREYSPAPMGMLSTVPVAQWTEQPPSKRKVAGSNPAGDAIYPNPDVL